MKPLKPKHDDMSEEDFYLGFLSIVKEHYPNLIEALIDGKINKQTNEALEVALNFYDTSLEIVKELCKLRDENKRLMNALKNSTKGDVK